MDLSSSLRVTKRRLFFALILRTPFEFVHRFVDAEEIENGVANAWRKQARRENRIDEPGHNEPGFFSPNGFYNALRDILRFENRQNHREASFNPLEHSGIDIIRANDRRAEVQAEALDFQPERVVKADCSKFA